MTPIDCINTQSTLGRNATPIPIIESVRYVLDSIDLDPASDEVINKSIQASEIFTYENDGFAKEWKAKNVWLNPPGKSYSKTLGKEIKASQWIRKLHQEYKENRIQNALVLVYRGGSLGSLGKSILKDCMICATCAGVESPAINGSGRISFEVIDEFDNRVSQTSNTQSSIFLLFSRDCDVIASFVFEFSKYGVIF
jgi:hypothetical protein